MPTQIVDREMDQLLLREEVDCTRSCRTRFGLELGAEGDGAIHNAPSRWLSILGRVAMGCAICVKLYCMAAAVPIWKFGMSWTEYYYCTVDDGV